MFGLSERTRVFLRTGITDLRLNFEGLRALVINVIREEPLSGHLFCFCNRSRNRVKCLIWDGSGFWICAKRLEKATFDWPKLGTSAAQMSLTQLQMLLEGFEFKSRKGWYRREEKMPINIYFLSLRPNCANEAAPPLPPVADAFVQVASRCSDLAANKRV